jgi:two-component system invasion response regulator UvrY
MVVDGDASVRAALREVIDHQPDLEWAGEADGAGTAVASCRAHRPDVVLMDVRIPGGGLAATRDIVAACPWVTVIALSAYADRHHRGRMAAAGAARFVTKGAPVGELLDAVREFPPTT